MQLTGELFIAAARVATPRQFRAFDPAKGEPLEPPFSEAGAPEIERACEAAEAAAPVLADHPAAARARLLESIAEQIEALGDDLLDRAHGETGLPLQRLTGERARTTGQLRLFAEEVREGGWMGLRIDPAQPSRTPLPRPDLRARKIPLGPVAVFGASNFPLAFSVAGGDTASALAAGCPVLVKGHPAHPGTSELVAGAVARAAEAADLPPGVFSLLNGQSHELGTALVSDPRVRAVAFTGSRRGGLALMEVAARRPVPIPVYAEMSAINPVVLTPGALLARAEALGAAYVASVTLGAGQFCTNPGLVLAVEGPELDRFVTAAVEALGGVPAATMLTPGIHEAYRTGVERISANRRVTALGRGIAGEGPAHGQAALFAISAEDLETEGDVAEEVFGAASVLVRCRDLPTLERAVDRLEGQLTATLHFEPGELELAARLLSRLERKAGRIIANGWPTGVEVGHAMVHGGPFPATSDGRSTSVGTWAIDRFLRPVCYQDLPDALLPPVLRDGGQVGVPVRHDGRLVLG